MLENVNVKSNGKMLELWLNDRSSYSELREAMIEKLSANKDFYSGISGTVMIYGKIFSSAQKRELKNMLQMDFSFKDVFFVDDEIPPSFRQPEPPKEHHQTEHKIIIPKPIENNPEEPAEAPHNDRGFIGTAEEELSLISTKYFDAKSIFVNQTVRNGMRIECEGDVIIIGDVNAGAEIIAGGSIAIFGRLRGLAHAGAKGRTDVMIIANSLQAKQIRIAGRISVLPAKREVDYPETAKLCDEKIIITALN